MKILEGTGNKSFKYVDLYSLNHRRLVEHLPSHGGQLPRAAGGVLIFFILPQISFLILKKVLIVNW